MRILFHVGVGNTDRPQRWRFVNTLFSDLARTFEALGHECLVWHHPKAWIKGMFPRRTFSDKVSGKALEIVWEFQPDKVFTWNGNSEGDKLIKEIFQKKVIFGELGFFNHYKTVHFDFKGVNGNSGNLTEELLPFDKEVYTTLRKQHKDRRIINDDFIFVPLQDEQDTNITKHSPIKKMDDLLAYVESHITSNIKVLYKPHPKVKEPLLKKRSNFYKVTENVHHYLPYAKTVIGINSTVLLETLLYHNRVVTLGKGITSRICQGTGEKVSKNNEYQQYITHLYSKQMKWGALKDISFVRNSFFYKQMVKGN